MDRSIDNFTMAQYLNDTYPTEDDSESKQQLIDFISESLSKNVDIPPGEMDHFMNTFTLRLSSISQLCLSVADMDDCPVIAVDSISKSIDTDLAYLLRDRKNLLQLGNGMYFLNLSSLADAVIFYKKIYDEGKIRKNMSRKQLELAYNEQGFQSKFSNVLFALSWMNFLRVYNNNVVHFNGRNTIYL